LSISNLTETIDRLSTYGFKAPTLPDYRSYHHPGAEHNVGKQLQTVSTTSNHEGRRARIGASKRNRASLGNVQPPTLHFAGWRFGPMCSECRYLELRDGNYWCTIYDLNVPNGAICDDYKWDGKIRVT